MGRRLVAIVLGLTAWTGCSPDLIGAADGTLRLSPDPLVFDAWVGYAIIEQATLTNSGRSTQEATYKITGPFRVRRLEESVPGGGKSVDVQFNPPGAGSFTGRLTVITNSTGTEHSIELLGYAQTPPPCQSTDPCESAEFDYEKGLCIRERKKNGSRCSTGNGCIVDETCQEGRCLGVARDCDDDDVCTQDSCSPEIGQCVHAEKSCPEPEEACKVAFCHPQLDCQIRSAPDGALCGLNSCELIEWCREGACQQFVPPDGHPCVRDCGEGKCKDNECVRPEGRRLAYEVIPHDAKAFGGTMIGDGEGALTFVENGTHLVGLNPEGFPLYRGSGMPLAARPKDVPIRMMRWDDRVVILGAAVLEMRTIESGSQVWSVSLVAGATLETIVPEVPVLARSGDTILTIVHQRNDAEQPCAGQDPDRFVRFHVRDGAGGFVRDRPYFGKLRQLPPTESGLVVADDGTAYFSVGKCSSDDELIGLDRNGDETLRLPLEGCRGCVVLAVAGELVYLSDGVVVRLGDRPARADLEGGGDMVRASGLRGYSLSSSPDQDGATYVHGIEDGRHAWTYRLPPELQSNGFTEAVVTSPALSLLAFDERSSALRETWVTELLPDGEVKRTCSLGDFHQVGPPIVGDEWLIVDGRGSNLRREIRRYAVPKVRLSVDGWPTRDGGPSRDARER